MEERRNAIAEMVNHMGTVTFRQLKEAFPNVSEMTLRTDLKALDQDSRLVRIHGGAKSMEQVVGSDGLISVRTGKRVEAKRLIARKAAALIEPNTTVFLDSGSTADELARALPDEPLFIFTSGLTCAIELTRLEHPEVTMVGGKLNRFSASVNGNRAIDAVRSVSFDQVFIGVTGCTAERGITCNADEDAALKRVCVHNASQVIALMDSSKLDYRGTFSICGLDGIDVIVSDGDLPADFLSRCAEAGVEVL